MVPNVLAFRIDRFPFHTIARSKPPAGRIQNEMLKQLFEMLSAQQLCVELADSERSDNLKRTKSERIKPWSKFIALIQEKFRAIIFFINNFPVML